MDIQLNTRLVLQLQEIAKAQEREINELLVDAIEAYVEANTNESAFRASVRQAMTDHKWLLDELAER